MLDPKTGGILAMAEAPTHDANASATKGLQTNHAVTDVFEPGSVFKVVTIAGALSEQLVTPQTRFTLPYSIQVADRRIHDAEQRGTETMSVVADPSALVERRHGDDCADAPRRVRASRSG